MTYPRQPGVYFTETVSTRALDTAQERIPLFLLQTSTAIADLDGVYTYYTGIDAFKEAVAEKGLTNTVTHIEKALIEYNCTNFYVYSIKTDTALGFKEAVKNSSHLSEVRYIDYYEETKSAQGNAIAAKIAAIKEGVIDNARNGVFRRAFITPYGTINDAVTTAENTTPAAAAIAAYTTILSATGSGRICPIFPDGNDGVVVGKCMATPYDEDPGYAPVESEVIATDFNFDASQIVTLQNLGVMFLVPDTSGGVTRYNINLGVTSSFKENAADGLYVSRAIADEVLNDIGNVARAFIKAKEVESNVKQLNTEVGNVIDTYATAESIIKADTILTVTDAGNNVFEINGKIKPIGCVIAIEVNTTIQ